MLVHLLASCLVEMMVLMKADMLVHYLVVYLAANWVEMMVVMMDTLKA